MNIDLTGRVAVVTGGAHGIGRATAGALARAGAKVAILDRDPMGQEVADAMTQGGDATYYVRVDVRDADQCSDAVAAVVRHFGGIDILFNNAGIIKRQSVVDLSEEDWDLVMDVNLKGVFLMSRAVIPVMKSQGRGGEHYQYRIRLGFGGRTRGSSLLCV